MNEREAEIRELKELEPEMLYVAIGLLIKHDTEVVDQFLQSCSLWQLQELRKIADWLITDGVEPGQ
jgi:hypothetical protein